MIELNNAARVFCLLGGCSANALRSRCSVRPQWRTWACETLSNSNGRRRGRPLHNHGGVGYTITRGGCCATGNSAVDTDGIRSIARAKARGSVEKWNQDRRVQ